MNLRGAPIGPQAYTKAYTRAKRVEKARPLLQALAELPDPQTGLLLLRHCAAYSRMVFALRVTPPQLLVAAAAPLLAEASLRPGCRPPSLLPLAALGCAMLLVTPLPRTSPLLAQCCRAAAASAPATLLPGRLLTAPLPFSTRTCLRQQPLGTAALRPSSCSHTGPAKKLRALSSSACACLSPWPTRPVPCTPSAGCARPYF